MSRYLFLGFPLRNAPDGSDGQVNTEATAVVHYGAKVPLSPAVCYYGTIPPHALTVEGEAMEKIHQKEDVKVMLRVLTNAHKLYVDVTLLTARLFVSESANQVDSMCL